MWVGNEVGAGVECRSLHEGFDVEPDEEAAAGAVVWWLVVVH